MASWFDKISKATETAFNSVNEAVNNTVKTYNEKGFEGVREKTSEILSKTGEEISKKANQVSEKSQEYLKNVNDSNKEIIKEVNENGENNLKSKIVKGLAVTANTTQIVVDDLTQVTNRFYDNLMKKYGSDLKNENTIPSSESILDQTDLVFVLKNILQGTEVSHQVWLVNNLKYKLYNHTWFNQDKLVGDNNAISLLMFHFAHLAEMDLNNPQHQIKLKESAIKLLSEYQPIEKTAPVVEKPVNQTTTTKTVKSETKPVVEKSSPVKKTVAKSSTPRKKVEKMAVSQSTGIKKMSSTKAIAKSVKKTDNSTEIRGKTATSRDKKSLTVIQSPVMNKTATTVRKKSKP